MRSVWKPDYFSKSMISLMAGVEERLPKKASVKVYDKASVIPEVLLGQRILVHTGKRMVSFLVRDFHIGRKFSYFFMYKSTGSSIHKPKKKGKKGKNK